MLTLPPVHTVGKAALLLAVAAAALAAPAAHAMTYCAATAGQIQAALTDAAGNAQNNTIRVVAGTYALSSGLSYSSSASNSVTILGGYSTGCTSFTGAATVLDGQNTVRPLHITAANADIRVEGFEFFAGLSTNNRGGGLSVNSSSGSVRIDLNTFIGNRADDYAGALFAGTGGTMLIRNNVFVGNSGAVDGAMELVCNGAEADITNNTVLGNSADTSLSPGGLRIGGAAHFNLSNNILWNNNSHGAVDFRADTGHLRLNNDIGTSDGFAADGASSANLSVDPQIAPCGFICFAVRLAPASPLVDAGVNAAPGALTAREIYGGARIIGGIVDIGAAELDVLFADGFE